VGRLRRIPGQRYCSFAKKLTDTVAGIVAFRADDGQPFHNPVREGMPTNCPTALDQRFEQGFRFLPNAKDRSMLSSICVLLLLTSVEGRYSFIVDKLILTSGPGHSHRGNESGHCYREEHGGVGPE
jgi:hypothetical protein